MILITILIIYFKDCREIGKENLAVPLSERLILYLMLYGIPVLYAVLKYLL